MSNTEYSKHTIKRYQQVIKLIPILYEEKYTETFKNPETYNEKFDKIIQMLTEKYKTSTLPNCISGIIWNLDLLYKDSTYDKSYITSIKDKYTLLNSKLISDNFKISFSNNKTLSEREEKTFQKWEDIINMYDIMRINLDKNNFNSFLEFVIISLYVLHPPVRADYANMKVFIDDSFVPTNYKENYCVIQTNPRFVFNKYKTSKKYGTKIINMNDELHNIILDWVNINTSEYLLTSYIQYKNEFKPFTEETLSHRIPLIFKKYTGIPSTINTMRHSYITHMNKSNLDIDTLLTNKNTSEKMMHSLVMADGYKRIV
jgi:hypothetical protein